MSSVHSILSRALNDRFNEVSNAISLAQGFADTMRALVRATNRAFEQGEHSVSGAWHYILDIEEGTKGSSLKPEKGDSLVLILNLHDTCKSDLRSKFVTLPEAGMALVFKSNGEVTALTSKELLPENVPGKIKAVREETFRIQRPNDIENFVASWLRGNLDAKTLVEIQKQMELQDQKEADGFWAWSQEQRDRLYFPEKLALK
jgi:hypothetical protein